MTNRPAPGWWMIPGAGLGLVLYALAGMAVAHVIWRDEGGGLVTYARAVEAGPPAEIRGVCASACTMWMANGCVHPDATLIFHGPEYPSGDDMAPNRFDYWSEYMARHYPPAIADWFMASGRFGEWQMTGAAAILAGAKPCEGE